MVSQEKVPFLYAWVNICIENSKFTYFFALKAQIQKYSKTAMDGSFRNFGKVSQDGLTCILLSQF